MTRRVSELDTVTERWARPVTEDSQQEFGSSNGGEDELWSPRVVLLGAHHPPRSLDDIDLAFQCAANGVKTVPAFIREP